MKILGIRNSTKCLRYAILNWDGNEAMFENFDGEHILKYPAEANTSSEKLNWLFDEINRILRQNTEIEHVGIKVSEYGRAEKKATRFTSHADAITLLACKRNNLNAQDFVYSSLPTNSKNVKAHAESIAGKTDKYWDAQIADAITVAYFMKGGQ